MTRIPFIVTHGGVSAKCALHVDRKLKVHLIEFVELVTGSLRDMAFARQLLEKIEFINDLMHAEMPFEALISCRRSPGMFGAILEPAAVEFENIREAIKEAGC
jgi:hypothetical protein